MGNIILSFVRCLSVVLVAVLLNGCTRDEPCLGDVIDYEITSRKRSWTPRNSSVTILDTCISSISYQIGVNRENEVTYITCIDEKLVLNNGIKIGSKFGDIKSDITGVEHIILEKYYAKINDEWYGALSEKGEPKDEYEIVYFFKFYFPSKKKSKD